MPVLRANVLQATVTTVEEIQSHYDVTTECRALTDITGQIHARVLDTMQAV